MSNDVNIINNPDFSLGKATPRRWQWHAKGGSLRFERGFSGPGGKDTGRKVSSGNVAGVVISSGKAKGTGCFSQTIVCKPEEHYRIEAIVACDLAADGDSRGLVLRIQPEKDEKPVGQAVATPGIHRTTTPTVLRAFFEAPAGVRRLRLSIGLVDASGTAEIHTVRVYQMIEPEEESHPLAIPAPAHTLAGPKKIGTIGICAEDADDRRITTILQSCLGHRRVKTAGLAQFRQLAAGVDALILPGPLPPPSLRSISALAKLTQDKVVIISLPAFVALGKDAVAIRRIVQRDDPICAKVAFANHATAGFALHDVFPFAVEDAAKGTYAQHQFRIGQAFQAFCKKHELEPLLLSMCDQDATSNRPIALHKVNKGGGLFVMDIAPAENEGSTRDEPVIAMHLILSILGQSQPSLGQYAVALRSESELCQHIREMSFRFQQFVVEEDDIPVEELPRQLVTIGREDQSFGLPLQPKPVIMIRSGLNAGDCDSVYGVLAWFKQLIRMPPHTCPYAEQLASKFRLCWVPCAAEWEWRDGWQRSGRLPAEELTIEAGDGSIDALIDVVACPSNRARIVVPHDGADFKQYSHWVPKLQAAFPPGRFFSIDVPDGEDLTDRTNRRWARVHHPVNVVVDPSAFETRAHRDVLDGGGHAVRIEIPGFSTNATAHSIIRTDLAATLLEQVIGLRFGMLAVNRQAAPAQLDRFAPVESGQTLLVERGDPMLKPTAAQVG